MDTKKMDVPFLNMYYLHEDEGTYACRTCNQLLFHSDHKIHAGSGWPCFDNSFEHALLTVAEQEYLEIHCSSCHDFLGYVFYGEKISPSDMRYNVKSNALLFKSKTL